MAITLLPTPPSRQDPINFNVRADEFLGALPTFGTEANSLATDVNNKQVTASNAATTATNAASTATTKAGEALASANAAATSASSANTARLASEAVYDSFDDRYLGQKPANPATDNDGGALLVGALYFRTTAPFGMKVWTGTAWDDAYANLSSKFDKTGGDVDGNLNLTGTGRRITGDFSNATASNRLLFQTSVGNGNTTVGAVPNGSGGAAGFAVYAKSDVTNSELLTAYATATSSVVAATKTGSGNFTPLLLLAGDLERLRIDPTTGAVLATSGAIGYGVGAGGTAPQTGSRSTGVALNKPSGTITLVNAAGSTAWQSFVLSNTFIGANDSPIVVQKSGTDLYEIHVTNVVAGSCRISFRTTGGTTTEQPVFKFEVFKGAMS